MNINYKKVKRIDFFKIAFILTLFLCFLPLLPGGVGIILGAFSFVPSIEKFTFSFDGFHQVFLWPGIFDSIFISIFIALTSTFLSVIFAFSILQSFWWRNLWSKIENAMAPILAFPHVAFAIGFSFLFTPSGFFVRIFECLHLNLIVKTMVDGNIGLVQDPYGIGLILALTIKEVPFILFMSIPILKELNVQNVIKTAKSLGYSNGAIWKSIIFPQWLPKIRFSLFAIISYSFSVVDLSLILGPTMPSTFAVQIWNWFSDAQMINLARSQSGAFLLFAISFILLSLIRLNEWFFIKKYNSWQYEGNFKSHSFGKIALSIVYFISISSIFILFIWSFAMRWPYPFILPTDWTFYFWQQEWLYIWDILKTSVIIALTSSTLALLLVFILHEHNIKSPHKKGSYAVPYLLIAIPILIPQLSILFGMQVAIFYIGDTNYYLWVLWSHLFFVAPYIYLALDGPWRSYDQRFDMQGLSLGMSPLKVWLKIKTPILFPSICIAWAIGISVSLAQYLPTLMLGGGRISTLTTEAVALASGQDRRISAIYALLQSLAPFFFYLLAILLGRQTGKLYDRKRNFIKNDIIDTKACHL